MSPSRDLKNYLGSERTEKNTRSKQKTERREVVSQNITVDFNTVTEENLIPEGECLAEVKRVEDKQGTDSGVRYFNWQFRKAEGRLAGRSLFMKTSVQPHALWKLQKLFEALGLPSTGQVSIDLDQLVGRRLFVTVCHREYDGKTQEEIKSFRACE